MNKYNFELYSNCPVCETHETKKPLKRRDPWNHETHVKPLNLWTHKSYETMKTMKPRIPAHETTKPMKARNLWDHETIEDHESF